jgi:uncharacterized protein YjbI with pentapeptide repeats
MDLSGMDLHGVELMGAELLHANLRNANLNGTKLNGANLSDAILEGAFLIDADLSPKDGFPVDLSGAHLANAHLRGAKMSFADLTGADLTGADLDGSDNDKVDLSFASLADADFRDAKLQNVDFTSADLGPRGPGQHGAQLYGADLSWADLTDAQLTDVSFDGADLQDVSFEPRSLPNIAGIAAAKHLELVTYSKNSGPLVQIRKQLQDNGFLEQERMITYALKRVETEQARGNCISRKDTDDDGESRPIFWSPNSIVANCGSFILNRIFFEMTCQYGMNPARALQIWMAFLFLGWIVYGISIHLPGKSGIYRVEKSSGAGEKEEIEERIQYQMISSKIPWSHPLRLGYQEARVCLWALYFSLVSAFNIGFRDLNFGQWLRLLPGTEYELKAKGWVRTVAGFQSLFSVYLIALWVLSYFGRPFE